MLLQLEVPFKVSLQTAQHARSKGVAVVWDPAPARELPSELYEPVDLFMPNQVEAMALTGVKVTGVPSARSASDVLRSGGVPVVVVKLGWDGALYTSAGGSGDAPAYYVDAVDAFGAALAVTRLGAQDAMPARDEIEALTSGS